MLSFYPKGYFCEEFCSSSHSRKFIQFYSNAASIFHPFFRSSHARMDFAALQSLSEEEGSLDKMEHPESDENNKENKPPSSHNSKNTSDKYNYVRATNNNIQTLSVSQFSPRQSLSIRIPKAKIDRFTQVSYNEIKAETGWTKPEHFSGEGESLSKILQ